MVLKTVSGYVVLQLNFKQAESWELLQVTIFCVDMLFHAFSPLSICVLTTLCWYLDHVSKIEPPLVKFK